MISNRGQNREFHEDWVASRRPTDPAEEARKGRVYVVAGGMGCGRNGEVASRSAVETIIRKYYAHSSTNLGDSLEAAFQAANSDLHLRSMFDPTKTACASALAMVVRGSEVAIINVGTNLAYAVGNGAAKRITRRPDHGGPGPDLKEARAAGGVGVATRALGSGPGLAADVVRGRLDPGDRIVLCSDGLHGVLDDREITYAARGRGPEDAARALMSLAQERGAEDDVSVIVVDCGSTPRADPAPPAGEPAKPPLRRLIQWRPSRSTSRALLAAGVLLLFTIGAAALIRGWTAAAGTLDATAYRPTPTPAPTVKQAPAVVPPATPPTKLPAVTSTPRLPTPLPVVAPVTEPTPSPTPSPTPTPEPSPTVAPVGVPTATPDPSPTPAAPMPTPAPAPTATPEPAATPIPDPTATPSPPIVIPLSTPTPQPAATPTPLPAPTAPPPTPTPKPSPPPTPIVLVTPAPQSPGARVEPGPKIGIPVPDMAWKWAGAPGPDFAYLIEVWERSPSGAWNLAPVGSPPGLDPFQISSSLTSVRPTWVSWKSGTVYRWRLKAYSKTGAGQSDFSDYLFFQTP